MLKIYKKKTHVGSSFMMNPSIDNDPTMFHITGIINNVYTIEWLNKNGEHKTGYNEDQVDTFIKNETWLLV